MTGFHVDTESFGPIAAQLRQAAQALQSAWSPVATASQGVQFGGGDDPVSPLIQVSLQGATSIVDQCIASCEQALNGYADGLERMARTYSDTEQTTTASFGSG